LILEKIIKIVATRCHIVRLKCTKFDFGWGSARPRSWILGVLLLRVEGGEGKRRGKGGERGEKWKKERAGPPMSEVR